MVILFFFVGIWYLSLFSQTFFQHRYAAHGSFTMNRFWERFFFLFSYITQGSSYMSPRAYAIMHRMHHAYTDTERDPHSPNFSSNIFAMMWRTRNTYLDIDRRRMLVEERFTKKLPNWERLDRVGQYTAFESAVGSRLYSLFSGVCQQLLVVPAASHRRYHGCLSWGCDQLVCA
ncbi:Fatty acid desaturase [Parapedobacter luteus]|uniref:Fatty acid desaturase n=1 Tax=Parapedobacter luteus TaxID=623280 RepID=A0A1T5B0U6_9SPHI|nr:fatty acid desaturase [Parapedobacter luteus]SKB40852.1 Fatty acid desaturase [Parapedobacter luteus]